MKFKLIIDKECQEEIVARVRTPNQLTAAIENLVLSYTGADTITVYTEDDILQLSFSQIELITVMDRKTLVVDIQGHTYRLYQRLWEVEQQLPSYFIRINKSTIANENHIMRYNTVITGAVDAIFRSGNKEYVSRRCFAEIRRRFERS